MEAPKLTTEETYKNIISAEGLRIDVETFDGFSLCWIGSKTTKKAIVYACGGALVMYAYNAHIKFLINSYKVMKANGQDVSIAIVNYGLSPDASYPSQIRHMVATVQHLLSTRSPESISLSGDSAGGMLILSHLLHHSHPHPGVASLTLPPGTRFGEAFLISPGVTITNTGSSHQQPLKDVLSSETLRKIWNVITSTSEAGIEMPSSWIAPSIAPEAWWQDLLVGKVSILVGDWEVLRDDTLKFAGHIKKYHDREVDIQVLTNEFHNQASIDLISCITEDKGSNKYWKAWFQNSRLD